MLFTRFLSLLSLLCLLSLSSLTFGEDRQAPAAPNTCSVNETRRPSLRATASPF